MLYFAYTYGYNPSRERPLTLQAITLKWVMGIDTTQQPLRVKKKVKRVKGRYISKTIGYIYIFF